MLPLKAPPLQRENRLYQADWLLRYYGFTVEEIAAGGEGGMLDLEIDPKLAWALKNRDRFPVDVNTRRARDAAARAGPRRARRRQHHRRAPAHDACGSTMSARLTPALKRARAVPDHRRSSPGAAAPTAPICARASSPPREQLSLFVMSRAASRSRPAPTSTASAAPCAA